MYVLDVLRVCSVIGRVGTKTGVFYFSIRCFLVSEMPLIEEKKVGFFFEKCLTGRDNVIFSSHYDFENSVHGLLF